MSTHNWKHTHNNFSFDSELFQFYAICQRTRRHSRRYSESDREWPLYSDGRQLGCGVWCCQSRPRSHPHQYNHSNLSDRILFSHTHAFPCRTWSLRCSMWTLTSGSQPSRSWSIRGLFRETNFPTASYNTKMPSLSRYRCHEALTLITYNINVGLLLHQLSPHRGRWPPHTQRWRVPNHPLSWSPSSPHSWRRDGWKSSLPPLCRERGAEKWRSTPDWMQLWKGWMDGWMKEPHWSSTD